MRIPEYIRRRNIRIRHYVVIHQWIVITALTALPMMSSGNMAGAPVFLPGLPCSHCPKGSQCINKSLCRALNNVIAAGEEAASAGKMTPITGRPLLSGVMTSPTTTTARLRSGGEQDEEQLVVPSGSATPPAPHLSHGGSSAGDSSGLPGARLHDDDDDSSSSMLAGVNKNIGLTASPGPGI
jgi:hypothetical protein